MNENMIYRKYSDYLKEKYGEKVYKLPINLPISCPNRVNGNGCSFCAEVGTGFECGLNIDRFNDVRVGDFIETYEEIEVKRTF